MADKSFKSGYVVWCELCGDHFNWPEADPPTDADNRRYVCKKCSERMRVGSFREFVISEERYGRTRS